MALGARRAAWGKPPTAWGHRRFSVTRPYFQNAYICVHSCTRQGRTIMPNFVDLPTSPEGPEGLVFAGQSIRQAH